MQGSSFSALIRHLVTTAHTLQERYSAELAANSPSLHEARLSLAATLDREVKAEEAADVLAQSAACAAPILAGDPLPDWLLHQLAPWERFALVKAAYLAPTLPLPHSHTPQPVGWDQRASRAPAHQSRPGVPAAAAALTHPTPPPAHLFEPFLHAYSATTRKRRGVYFTPAPVAQYIVTQLDHLLRTDFHLPNGLATHSALPAPRSALLFDPACGTGVFLLAIIDHAHRALVSDPSSSQQLHRWNAFVENLLPRLIGIEILPAAAFLTKLNLTQKLAATGYDFASPTPLQIHCADALSPALNSALRAPRSALPVLLGNPPFSSLSTTTNPWIAQLVRGDDEVRGYVQANGQRLGERKTWLHDDYVKFIRLAQWHIEQAGCGLVGFVTNHGYLENATFRLMRQELLRVFDHIQIIDLHGNRRARGIGLWPVRSEGSGDRGQESGVGSKKHGGRGDENLFHLDQGLAISLLSRLPPNPKSEIQNLKSSLLHLDLLGPRESKLAALADPALPARATKCTPAAPHYRFTPAPLAPTHPEYSGGWSLEGAMPIHCPAPVTARDHFVVAFTREELEQRLIDFRDLRIADDEIRSRYFTRTRSARYAPGDTRSWKLPAARQTIAADADWQAKIIRCLYRPFDWRYVFWHPAMIDWPRTSVTRHLFANGCPERGTRSAEQTDEFPHSALRAPRSALCLIARRQQLPTQPCTFFWISDGLALDGVIRSDNRGSESLFPLFIGIEGQDSGGRGSRRAASGQATPGSAGASPSQMSSVPRANFAPAFIQELTARVGRSPAPLETFAYIYALFHSPTYRERYADSLRTAFPRILLPRSAGLFTALCDFGHQLISLHLLKPLNPVPGTQYSVHGTPDMPAHSASASDLGPWTLDLGLDPTPEPGTPNPEPLASFRAGGHLALKKWLQPPHRSAADPQYARLATAIGATQQLMPAIDAAIDRRGGWPLAFAPGANSA